MDRSLPWWVRGIFAFAFWRFGWGDTTPRGASSLTPLWLVQAVFFGVVELILLLLPLIAEAIVFGSLFIRHLVRPSPKGAFL